MEYSIKCAEYKDSHWILEIKKASFKDYIDSQPNIYRQSDVLYTDDFISVYFNNENAFPILCFADDTACGFMLCKIVDVNLPMMQPRKYIYLDDIAVMPQFRNHGIASLMLRTLENLAVEKNIDTIELAVHLTNTNALSLYEKFGYAVRTYRMEKKLKAISQNC